MKIKILCFAAMIALFSSMLCIADDAAIAKCKNLAISEAGFKAPFARLEPFVIENGGVRIVECDGGKYLFAIGMTDLRDDSPREKLRRLTVARTKAVRELIRMIEKTRIEVKEESKGEVKIVQDASSVPKVQHEETSIEQYREEIDSFIKVPEVVATWQSENDQFFYVAIGKKLSAAK
ncbi:MAG: LPP20 family lipoprotein [Victivallaceae bacterium]|jgi:hypothetical protein